MWHLEQVLSAKTRLNANLTQWRHEYANEYVTSPAATVPQNPVGNTGVILSHLVCDPQSFSVWSSVI